MQYGAAARSSTRNGHAHAHASREALLGATRSWLGNSGAPERASARRAGRHPRARTTRRADWTWIRTQTRTRNETQTRTRTQTQTRTRTWTQTQDGPALGTVQECVLGPWASCKPLLKIVVGLGGCNDGSHAEGPRLADSARAKGAHAHARTHARRATTQGRLCGWDLNLGCIA